MGFIRRIVDWFKRLSERDFFGLAASAVNEVQDAVDSVTGVIQSAASQLESAAEKAKEESLKAQAYVQQLLDKVDEADEVQAKAEAIARRFRELIGA